jgi:hypothetical protein
VLTEHGCALDVELLDLVAKPVVERLEVEGLWLAIERAVGAEAA